MVIAPAPSFIRYTPKQGKSDDQLQLSRRNIWMNSETNEKTDIEPNGCCNDEFG